MKVVRVHDRNSPWRVGVVVKKLKTRTHVKWSNGEIEIYDKAHEKQFLVKEKNDRKP